MTVDMRAVDLRGGIMSETTLQASWSASVEAAMRWAQACATLRGSRQVGENEVFLGILLAHPDSAGEMRVLLEHFGLKARDLLPDDYPPINVDALRHASATVGATDPTQWAVATGEIVAVASSTSGGRPQLVHLMGGLLTWNTPWQGRLQAALTRFGVAVDALASEFNASLPARAASAASTEGFDLERGVVGDQIREWLDRRFPRRAAAFAGIAGDGVDPTADFVNVGPEADAFAYLVASKALVPPLAIGLFGQWGSGKSFLMAKIRHRVAQLTRMAAENPTPELQLWPDVAAVEFNAWHYVETDLWAALLHHIFAVLSPTARERLSDFNQAKQEATKRLSAEAKHAQVADEKLSEAVAEEERRTQDLREVEAELKQLEEQADGIRRDMLTRSLERSAGRRFGDEAAAAATTVFGEDLVGAVEAAARVGGSEWWRPWYWTGTRLLYLIASVAVGPCVALLISLAGASKAASWITGLAVGVSGVAAAVTAAVKSLDEQHRAAKARVDELVDSRIRAAEHKLLKATEDLTNTRYGVQAAQQAAEEANARMADVQHEVDHLTPGTRLGAFLSGRSDDYRKRLTQLTTISEDLRTLAARSRAYNEWLAGNPKARTAGADEQCQLPPNRIVLYIDDLDRCPPKRVVEVLEAVHLLLAFELFVVFVAVDSRWLVSALPQELTPLDPLKSPQPSAPSAMDYVEKIFQIPFQVQPLDVAARRRLLRGFMLRSVALSGDAAAEAREYGTLKVTEVQAELVQTMLTEPGSWLDLDARQLSITPDELSFLESLASLTAPTPRQVKRLVNVCQFVLAMSPPLSGDGDPPTERMGACFLAALHSTMPDFAECLVSKAEEDSLATTLESVLSSLEPGEFTTDHDRLKQWLESHKQAGHHPFEKVPVERLLKRWGLIQRLAFDAESLSPKTSSVTP
jgi:hypothetical protein